MREKNKSHKIWAILGIVVMLCLVLTLFFFLNNRHSSKKSIEDKNIEVINESINQKDTTNVVKEEKEEQNTDVKTDDNSVSKEEQEKEIKHESPKSETKKEEKQPSNESPKVDTKNDINAWDELGITENEYYNSPAWSWAKVDFAIEKYGSQEKCLNACIEYGESTGMGYSCSTINSYSGRYLGEMIKLF